MGDHTSDLAGSLSLLNHSHYGYLVDFDHIKEMIRPTLSILEIIGEKVGCRVDENDVKRFGPLIRDYGAADVNYALHQYALTDPIVFPSVMQIESIIKRTDAERQA